MIWNSIRKNNIVLTGPTNVLKLHTVSHVAQSAASVATADEAVCDDNKGQTENELNELKLDEESMMRDNFIKFADEKLNVKIMDHEILAVHKLPKRKNGTEPVLIKFSRNCTKRNLMKKSPST